MAASLNAVLILVSITASWCIFVEGKIVVCSKSELGSRIVYQKVNGDDDLLFCGKENGLYKWKFLDGSRTLGEKIDPAKDCSDIVDNVLEAKDGFYWVVLDNSSKIVKVWCDVHVDGGGFMLVGKTGGPSLWKVPSNSTPVDPKGQEHWSSELGSFKMEYFAIQVSNNDSFAGTQAYWTYKLKTKRDLGDLFGIGNGTGCTDVHSGIGDVEYVKDILTETVVTKNFNCSKFGPHYHVSLGWGRMNYCFRNKCPRGYAFIQGLPFQYDSFGSFSYSVPSSLSGITHDATAFVGCDDGKCCVCYGPKGGRGDYCGPKCNPINGGTVKKEANVWFWIRTRMPMRIWKRCMEFKKKNEQGNVETFFVDKVTGSVHKGSCSHQFQAYLNEGTLSVKGKEGLRKLPSVQGLLSYRKDNQELYVNNGSQWRALSMENEVEKLQTRIKQLEEKSKIMGDFQSCSSIKMNYPDLQSGSYRISPVVYGGSRQFEVFCDMSSKNGIGVTEVGHNSENRTKVDGYEGAGSYSRNIVYKGNLADIAELTNVSQHCEQLIRWECFGSMLFVSPNHLLGWWVSRQGTQMTYWGGATGQYLKCACGVTNSCAGVTPGDNNCNCAMNDYVDRKDEGYLTDKDTLPVTELRFGDTGGNSEYGHYTLGKLICWG